MNVRLVVFDVDGTLSDSQHHIHSAMSWAFAALGLPAPSLAQVTQIVGLSLPQAVAQLAPDLAPIPRAQIVDAYKASYRERRLSEPAPLYPGAADCLRRLAARKDLVLGIATGKSRRGLDSLLEFHELERFFVTRQVADDHPSKPHPSMLLAALAETGTQSQNAVMIGDTSFDMEMGRAARLATIGVTWGYHSREHLVAAGAGRLVDDFAALLAALDAQGTRE